MVGAAGITHYRTLKNNNKKARHPNIEPLCQRESVRLLNANVVGYMSDEISDVNCLACRIIFEREYINSH